LRLSDICLIEFNPDAGGQPYMKETERISDQLRRAFEGNAWHGPSLNELLAGVDSQTAAARPVAGAHTIWELLLHVGAWTDTATRRLQGEALVEPRVGNFPSTGETEPGAADAAWEASIALLERAHHELQAVIGELDDSSLDELPYQGANATRYVLLHGTVQHCLYHAGQIALLKRALLKPVNRRSLFGEYEQA
jgi:uncharacterized damage-inducible protein DinB